MSAFFPETMRGRRFLLLLSCALSLGVSGPLRAQEEAESEEADSSAGLPPDYAENYLVAKSALSPDKKFAIIYPTLEFYEANEEKQSKEARNLLVALEPFKELAPLPTGDPYFERKSHGGLSADWSEDGRVALITLESKWGPGDVFVVEMADGKVKRITNLLAKVTKLLLPQFRKAVPGAGAYNDNFEFIFEPVGEPYETCTLIGSKAVKIDLSATNDPKSTSDHPWRRRVKAQWDIAGAKFTSQKITHDRR